MVAEKQKPYYVIKNEDTGEEAKVPRVTSILDCVKKPGLDHWRGFVGNKEADRISQEGADIGHDFHEIAADIGRGVHNKRGWQPDGRYRDMVYAYIDWLHKNIVEVVEVEKLVHSSEHNYAGTTDLVAILRGDSRPAIIDVKTSNAVDITWPLQLSAYQTAIGELSDLYENPLELRRVIIRVPKKGLCVPEMYEYKDHAADRQAWLSVLDYWKWTVPYKTRAKEARVIDPQ